MATILYFGDSWSSSTSAHRANALKRLGHDVVIHDPYHQFTKQLHSRWFGPLHHRTGFRFLQAQVARWTRNVVSEATNPDFIWIDSGELFGAACIRAMHELPCPVILYNIDDPTGKRDGHKFDSLIKALPLYNLVVVVRKETEKECYALGAKQVMRVMRSYDEVAHQPFSDKTEIPPEFTSEVAFIGTWMRYEKRDEFLLALVNQGIRLSIWGSRWKKSPHWVALQPYYRGEALGGRAYVAAMQGAKVCLGMLSKGNRDLHTTRSLEVPYAGGLLCAERTTEHVAMYQDGVEAAFWSDAAECAAVCKQLLENDEHREAVRLAGMRRVRSLAVGNEDVCEAILAVAAKSPVQFLSSQKK